MTELKIVCTPGVQTDPEEVRNSHLLAQWLERLERFGQGINVQGIRVLASYKWGKPVPELKMMHVIIEATTKAGRKLDGIALLRGATVDVLALVRTPDDPTLHAIFVRQPRVPGAQTVVVSNPSGMVDAGEDMEVAGLRELAEELDERKIVWSDTVNLGEHVTGSPDPMLVSPGASDEVVQFLATVTTLTPKLLQRLNNKFGGSADEGEETHIMVVPLDEAISWLKLGGQVDVKALTSLLLYDKYRGR